MGARLRGERAASLQTRLVAAAVAVAAAALVAQKEARHHIGRVGARIGVAGMQLGHGAV